MCVYVCACMCMHVHAYVHQTPPNTPMTNPTPKYPSATPQGVDPQNQQKCDNTSTNQDISILFEDLKSVKNSIPMGGCMVWWLGGCVDGWGQVKTLKNFKKLTESR